MEATMQSSACWLVLLLAGCGGGDLEEPTTLDALRADAQAVLTDPPRRTAAASAAASAPSAYAGALLDPRRQSAAAAAYLHGVNLFHDDRDELLAAVAEHAAAHPALPVIRGYGWRAELFDGAGPTAAELDAVVPDRPVILLSSDLRRAWRNSRAMGLPLVPAGVAG
jgi:hypothetical protein